MRFLPSRGPARAVALTGTAVALASTFLLAPASADAGHPAPFTDCPVGMTSSTGNPVVTCIAAVGLGGEFKLGKTTVTLTPGTDLQGGLAIGNGVEFIEPADGGALTGPDQDVPGGLLGIAHLENLLPGVTDIKAEVRLVGQPGFALGRDIKVTLPVQVQLKNLLLGPHCVIGTPANPVVLHLTTGTSAAPDGVTPLQGKTGTPGQPDLGSATVLEFAGQELVDNGFAVPGATGCGLLGLGLLDRVVDQRSGLPAAAGVSEARLVTNTFIVAATQVDQVSGYDPTS
jgi:hypothetical protein